MLVGGDNVESENTYGLTGRWKTSMARLDIQNTQNWLNVAEQSGYRSRVVSRKLGICPRQLRRHTKAIFVRSAQRWLDERQLIRAAGLLKVNPAVKIVALSLGFRHISQFSRPSSSTMACRPPRF